MAIGASGSAAHFFGAVLPPGKPSEARMRTRLASAVLLALLTAAVATGVALAQWPTTCVDLNDIAEAHLDNHGNVGIYQRVFGDQAEQACQQDHRGSSAGIGQRPMADHVR